MKLLHVSLPTALLLSACPAPEAPAENPGPDYEALCAGVWLPDECADGDCADSDVERRYGEVWLAWAQDETGLSDADFARHVALRRVDTDDAEQSSWTEVTATYAVDWVRFVHTGWAGAEGGDPTEAAIRAAWEEASLPRVDWDATLAPYADMRAEVEACEADLGVDFPETGWCGTWFTTYTDDDAWLSLRFTTPYEGGGTAILSLDPTGVEPRICRVDQDIDE